jgi:hypothetical protein
VEGSKPGPVSKLSQGIQKMADIVNSPAKKVKDFFSGNSDPIKSNINLFKEIEHFKPLEEKTKYSHRKIKLRFKLTGDKKLPPSFETYFNSHEDIKEARSAENPILDHYQIKYQLVAS